MPRNGKVLLNFLRSKKEIVVKKVTDYTSLKFTVAALILVITAQDNITVRITAAVPALISLYLSIKSYEYQLSELKKETELKEEAK